MKNTKLGFTLIEILVVTTIIGILAAVVFSNFRESSEKSRDIQRKSDLRQLQSAIELYKNENGQYPMGCNATGAWSGQRNSGFKCGNGTSNWISGLVEGDFIATLPSDPKLNPGDGNSGYAYLTNGDRTVYKLMANKTVESEIVDYDNPFKSCDTTNNGSGVCDAVVFTPSGGIAPNCAKSDAQFQNSFAVWGGWANRTTDAQIETHTENVICRMP